MQSYTVFFYIFKPTLWYLGLSNLQTSELNFETNALTTDICEEIKPVINRLISKYLKTDTFIDKVSKKVSYVFGVVLENRLQRIEDTVVAL